MWLAEASVSRTKLFVALLVIVVQISVSPIPIFVNKKNKSLLSKTSAIKLAELAKKNFFSR